jgi:hypothetical protein
MNSARAIIILFLFACSAMAQDKSVSNVEYSRLPESTVGIIRVRSWEGGAGFVAEFDAAVEAARYDDGLIFDVRGAHGGDTTTVALCMGRLTSGVILTTPEIHPRGEWQFDLPMVILMDESCAPPTDFFLRAATLRSQIETVGRAMRIGGKTIKPGYVLTNEMYQTMRALNPDRDPIFEKGLDELYRMIGRLKWLQDERRKEMLQDTMRPRGTR